MNTEPQSAWDNQQVAHFLSRADRRVLSQPHSWLHAGVGDLKHVIHVEAPEPSNKLDELNIAWRSCWVAVFIALADASLPLIIQKITAAYFLVCRFIAVKLPYWIFKG